MKQIRLLLTGLFLFISCASFAQNIQVTGTVTDATTGKPVSFASVVVKETSTGTNTLDDGSFSLNVAKNGTLVISFIGYETQEVAISNRSVINVALKPDAISLEDAVVVGYGSAKKLGSTVGSVTQVKSEKIALRPQPSAIEALQGQVAGLQIYTSTGEPGDIQTIRLHGTGSLGASSTPLYVLDGIPVSSATIRAMNSNDIASISVLKDASATSIYGSRAANGVIFITSKRGSTSDAKIVVNASYANSTLADRSFYDNLMSTDELFNFWLNEGIRTNSAINSIKSDLVAANMTTSDGEINNFSWGDYLLAKSNPIYQGDISISGGARNTRYYISGSYFSQDGINPGTFFKRTSLRANIDTRVKKWMKIALNTQLSYDEKQRNANWSSNYVSGGLSYLYQPYFSPHLSDGSTPDKVDISGITNQYYWSDKHPNEYDTYRAYVSGYVEIEPIKGLIFKSQPGLTKTIAKHDYSTSADYIGSYANGSRGMSNQDYLDATITNTLEYTFNFADKHVLNVLGGQEAVYDDYTYFSAYSSGQTDSRLMQLDNGLQANYDLSSSDSKSQILSYFARADYNFDRKYYFDATIRNDACSRFGKDNRNATFWSVGGKWKMKEENFMNNVSWVDDLDFKVSYGTQGNAGIGNYEQYSTVSATTDYNGAASWAVADAGNPQLQWETQKLLTVAANGRFFNKVNVELEYYIKKTADMLMSVPVPYTTGYSEITKNVGGLSNKGIDLTVNVDILQGKDYYLGAHAVFNYNKEEITSLFDGREKWVIANTGVAYVVGSPVMYYYPIFKGINPENGKQQWYVPGDDVDTTTKDDSNVTEDFDEASLEQNTGKKRYAPVTGGFGFNATYKAFSLSADFNFALGKYLISNDRFFSENPAYFAGYNTSKAVSDSWQQPGDIVDYPDWSSGAEMQFDTHLLENASFCRLKNLTLTYLVPQKLINRQNVISNCKIYFTGRNLLTWTKKSFKGIDPEVDSNLTMGNVGNTKELQVGIQLTF